MLTEQVSLKQNEYRIQFTESGLPAGTPWSLVFKGNTYTSNSTNYGEIVLYASNGSFAYDVVNGTLYYSTQWYSSTGYISGHGLNFSVDFIKYSTLAGVLTPANATIYVNGVAYHPSANGSYTIELTAGNYSLKFVEPGYTTKYDNVTLGTGQTIQLNFTLQQQSVQPKTPGPNAPANNNLIYIAIGGVVAVATIGGSLFVLRRKR